MQRIGWWRCGMGKLWAEFLTRLMEIKSLDFGRGFFAASAARDSGGNLGRLGGSHFDFSFSGNGLTGEGFADLEAGETTDENVLAEFSDLGCEEIVDGLLVVLH